MREKYESLSLGALKEIARARGMRGLSSLKKRISGTYAQEDEKDKKMAEKKEEHKKKKARERIIRKKSPGERNIKRKRARKEEPYVRLWNSLNWTAARA